MPGDEISLVVTRCMIITDRGVPISKDETISSAEKLPQLT